MKVKVIKLKNVMILINEETLDELMYISMHDVNRSYRIIDYRYTKKSTKPTPYLGDVASIEAISFEDYEKHKKHFNFPVRITSNEEGFKIVNWKSMNGVVLEGADRKDKDFSHMTESHVWSYKASLKKLKECKEFWENYEGEMKDAKKQIKNKRPVREFFYSID
jgi:hypothetical protein